VSSFVEATAKRKLSSNTACDRSVIDLVQQDDTASTGLGSSVTLIQLNEENKIVIARQFTLINEQTLTLCGRSQSGEPLNFELFQLLHGEIHQQMHIYI
jgi:hypothetical protein